MEVAQLETADTMQLPSKEVPKFLSLPPEIRLQIYRGLLIRKPWITPELTGTSYPFGPPAYTLTLERKPWKTPDLTGACYPFEDPPAILYPNILRTCYTIYKEASSVLYGDNVFWYRCLAKLDGERYAERICKIPRNALNKIEKVEIGILQRMNHCKGTTICSAINNIATFDISLRVLRLHFFIDHDTALALNRGTFIGTDGSRSVEVIEALCRLKVQQRVEVRLDTDKKCEGKQFQAWIDAISDTKGWNVRMRERVDIINQQYVWEWILEPQRQLGAMGPSTHWLFATYGSKSDSLRPMIWLLQGETRR